MSRLRALAPPPRLVDFSILVLVLAELASGLVSLVSGRPSGWWVFALHSIGGLLLLVMVAWKLARVRHRVLDRAKWTPGTRVSIALSVLALSALLTGIAWVFGLVQWVGPWPLVFIHAVLGVSIIPVLLWHLRHRFRLPSSRDVQGRRTAIQYGVTAVAAVLAWRVQNVVDTLTGDARRFTGSREEGSADGNDFPVTSWVADDPDPVDREAWALRVDGATERSLALEYADVAPEAEREATLDCTSGWYSSHDWQGVRVGALLDAVEPTEDAAYVRFRSVTGYRWTLPIEEARDALLATHVDGERLSHGHGAPLRLVAPGRRGFQWVKWVTAVDVRRNQDPAQWVAVFVSGL